MKNHIRAEEYRKVLEIKELLQIPYEYTYPICPRCGITLEREYLRFCNNCGQHLGWRNLAYAKVINSSR